ncbi:OLC1v1023504C1 [Oldenlandia corymbosa var. corymbosa]|uniref:OLC1v1023504C1 n=1 Tax=Oldenlandia corymbosa var. corymbosa TaxID=529605 RepID=A0AAV1C2X6_OLDCO|nr:OLC1v1023504C1 [Oldenlandia corymbosa var. corymbosa]
MGKKLISQIASTKISKNEKKNLNSLIKILKPKVYITDASNFKRLVQDLTGNRDSIMPSYYVPPSIPKPVISSRQVPAVVVDIDDEDDDHHRHDHATPYREHSFDSSVESSEASMLTSFNTSPAESPQELDATLFERDLASHKAVDLPVYGDIESWLMEIDSYNYQLSNSTIPAYHQQVGGDHLHDYNNYDFSELMI